MSSLASKAAALKSRTVEVSFKDIEAPDTSGDILTTFESNAGIKSETANEWTINVFPDFMVLITYIMLIVRRFSLADDARIHPKVSTPTVAMYYVSIVYGFFLASDCYLRPSPSAYARLWKESSWRHDFLEFLMTLPVPEDLVPLLAQFAPSETERSKNIFWIPSAAAFSLKHYFGRFLPLNFFSVLHDAASSLPGNSNKLAVMTHVLKQHIIRINQANPAYQTHYLMADFLGYSLDQTTATTANYINSKFHQVFSSVFNPVLFRDYQRRSSLAEIGLNAPQFKAAEPNAYDILFCSSAPNLAELRVVLQTVSSFLKGNVACKKTLGQILSESSGIAICSHGYAEYHLPILVSNPAAADFSAITALQRVEFVDRAQDMSFLDVPAARPVAGAAVQDVQYMDNTPAEVPVPANHRLSHVWPFSLFSNTAPNANTVFPRMTRAAADVIIFDDSKHVYPTTLLLDIGNDGKSSSAVPLLCGKIIYSFEIDGSTIEQPNASKALGMQNVLFADSAIPFERVVFATKFYPRAQGSVPSPLARATANSTRSLPASSMMHDRTKVYIPRIHADIFNAAHPHVHIQDAGLTGIPGTTVRDNTDWFRYAQSFLGFRTVDPSGIRPTSDNIANMEQGRLLLWSPYTYVSYEDSDDITPNYAQTKRYFLVNLRTFFGTDYNLVEMKHPFEALPVS
uniref:Capsid protein n=1 Tax=Rosellinia necatrix partitivirus 4 TaxID=1148493 RepID=A0A6F8UNZ7_9VIRU|nr:capsid protein [Rosellinia necatrix partitivirus 4]